MAGYAAAVGRRNVKGVGKDHLSQAGGVGNLGAAMGSSPQPACIQPLFKGVH